MYIHTVLSGESPGQIERRFGLEKGSIAAFNALSDPNRLTKGLALGIPSRAPAPAHRRELWLSAATPLPGTMLDEFSAEASFMVLPCLSEERQNGAEHSGEAHAITERVRNAGALPMAYFSITDEKRLHALFQDEAQLHTLCAALTERLSAEGWAGMLLELPALPAFCRECCSSFIRSISETLHGAGLRLALKAELCAVPSDSALDMQLLSGLCERLLLCPQKPSGRFDAPLFHESHLRTRLESMIGSIQEEKCVLLCPITAVDRAENGVVRVLSMATAADTACALGAEIHFDRAAGCSHFDYADPMGQRHRVWFEDIRSLERHCLLAEEYSLGGIGIEDCARLSPPGLELLCMRLDPLRYL